MADQLARAPLSQSDREELASVLGVLAGLRLARSVVEQVLGRNPMLRDLLGASSLAEIWREEGEVRGLAKGLTEGKLKGVAEGQRTIVQALLESRFGPLDAAEVTAVQQAEEPLLRALATHLANDSREQVRVRLVACQGRNGR